MKTHSLKFGHRTFSIHPPFFAPVASFVRLAFLLGAFLVAGTLAFAQQDDSVPTPKESTSQTEAGYRTPGAVRIGIASVTSSANPSIATQLLQEQLLKELASLKLEVVPLTSNPDDHDAIEAEAERKQCDYFVLSDITSLKRFGGSRKATSNGHAVIAGARTAAEVSVKAYLPGQMRPVLDGANNYSGGDVKSTMEKLIQAEAKSIATEIRKVKR